MHIREHGLDPERLPGRSGGFRTSDRLLLCLVAGLQLLLLWRLRPGEASNPAPPDDPLPVSDAAIAADSPARDPAGGAPGTEARSTLSAEAPPSGMATGRTLFGWPVRMRPYRGVGDDIGMLVARDWERLQRTPAMDVVEMSDSFVVVFSVPEVEAGNVAVSMDRGVLTVEWPMFADRAGRYGRTVRRLKIPGVAPDIVKPGFILTNGFLRVYLPKN